MDLGDLEARSSGGSFSTMADSTKDACLSIQQEMEPEEHPIRNADEEILASLGYKQGTRGTCLFDERNSLFLTTSQS